MSGGSFWGGGENAQSTHMTWTQLMCCRNIQQMVPRLDGVLGRLLNGIWEGTRKRDSRHQVWLVAC